MPEKKLESDSSGATRLEKQNGGNGGQPRRGVP